MAPNPYAAHFARQVANDVIAVLEHHEMYDKVGRARFRCRECGGRLKGNAGYVIRALRFIGRWPREKTMVMPAWERVPGVLATARRAK